MAAVETYTKTGAKATTPAELDKAVFGIEVKSHQLLKDAYLGHLANQRTNNAVTKKRGQVSGGGIKPWRQKGTGRARFGSSRNPIWRGGGIAFGPTGQENYTRKLSVKAKRQSVRQALSLAAQEDRIKIIESFNSTDGKVKATVSLLKKMGVDKNTLLIVQTRDELVARATRNLPQLKVAQAGRLSAFHVLNADTVVIAKDALETLSQRLGDKDE